MMKYKVGVSKNKDKSIVVLATSVISRCKLSIVNPINGNSKKVRIIIAKIFLGYEGFSNLPSLLKKTFSLSKLSGFAFLTTYGTPISIIQKTMDPMVGGETETEKPIAQPKLMLSQSIRFQKLSLFKRALIKFFISSLEVISINLIVARFKEAIKAISKVLLIVITTACLIPACFAEDSAKLLSMIAQVEDRYSIPRGLLLAIAKTESGSRPYALNVSGKPVFAPSKQKAVAVAHYHLSQGKSNIDLGVMQLNFYWHGKNFKSIEDMLTPSHNIEYGAKFLKDLYNQHGTWQKAVRHYHSSNPDYHKQYSRKVLISWLGI